MLNAPQNKERFAKKHFLGKPQSGFVIAPPGFMNELKDELATIFSEPILKGVQERELAEITSTVLSIRNTSLEELSEICFRSGIADDVLWQVLKVRAKNKPDLSNALNSLPLELVLPEKSKVIVKVNSVASAVFHEGALFDLVSEALTQRGWQVCDDEEGFVIQIELRRDVLHCSVSLAGLPLYRRGYRAKVAGGIAPLKETLARGALFRAMKMAAFPKPDTIFVPFSGTGTLAFESVAALQKLGGGFFARPFSVEKFSFGPLPFLKFLRQKIRQNLNRLPTLLLMDNDKEALEIANLNFQKFASFFEDSPSVISLDCRDFFESSISMDANMQSIFVPLNPPYGKRIHKTRGFYGQIAQKLVELKGSVGSAKVSGFILCGNENDWQEFKRVLDGKAQSWTSHFTQGGLDIRICSFRFF